MSVTLMDLQMPGVNGIDAIATIRQEHPQARIIVLTTYEGDVLARRALKAGATGYILKDMIRTELLEAIRAVHLGRKYIPQKIAAELVDHCLHMRLHGCLRNGKVRSDYLVGRAARYFSKYFDFALAEIIFCINLNDSRNTVMLSNLGPIWVRLAGSKNSLEDRERAVSTVEIQ